MPSLKLVSLNIEGSRHLDVVVPFLQKMNADVVCLQEVIEADIKLFADAVGAQGYVYAPMTLQEAPGMDGTLGAAIFYSLNILKQDIVYYSGDGPRIVPFDRTSAESKQRTFQNAILSVTIEKGNVPFTIATTHFPWTADGEAQEFQRVAAARILHIIDQMGECVVTGDFNAPRGKEIFGIFAAHLTDNIPSQITTSIDGSLHRAGQLPYMVDGIFSTKNYRVTDVVQTYGVSDHTAFSASVIRI